MIGTVEAIFVTDRGGAPMRRVEAVDAVENAGLCGDRYLMRTGYWTDTDECQVTLIEGEALDEIAAQTALRVVDGQHRRNLVTRGVVLSELAGKRFRVGEAVLAYDRPRPPCGYIQILTGQKGITKALGGARGGICARVVAGGTIRAGDAIAVLA